MIRRVHVQLLAALLDLIVDTSNTFLNALESGVRPKRPEICPEDIYKIMEQCWRIVPEERPSFEVQDAQYQTSVIYITFSNVLKLNLTQDLGASLGHHVDPSSLHHYDSAREEVKKRYSSLKEATYCKMSRSGAGDAGFLPPPSQSHYGTGVQCWEQTTDEHLESIEKCVEDDEEYYITRYTDGVQPEAVTTSDTVLSLN